MVLQTKGSLLTCRCFSNAQVSFFAQRFALENHPTCFLAKLALRRTIGAWSEPRLLEAPKHLLWIDDESRHAESALEDAFKAFSSLGVNQLNVSGTFNWHRACGRADVFFCNREFGRNSHGFMVFYLHRRGSMQQNCMKD